MAKIPVNLDNLRTEYSVLDDSVSYRVICRSVTVAEEPDKNGHNYLKGIKLEVTEPSEFAGRNIFVNYVALPVEITPNMSVGERRAAEDVGVQFAQMVKCLNVPLDENGDFDTDLMLGCEGEVTVRTDEYQGRKSSKVKDWLLP